MTRRNRRDTWTTTKVAKLLDVWLDRQPQPRGEVLTGEAAFRLRRDPDTTVGIDVAYVSAEVAAKSPENAFLIEGAPVLAVEILSPKDRHEDIVAKVEEYLGTGVRVVWIMDPDLRTVTVYRADEPPALFNVNQELTGGPFLPGFLVPVAELFKS